MVPCGRSRSACSCDALREAERESCMPDRPANSRGTSRSGPPRVVSSRSPTTRSGVWRIAMSAPTSDPRRLPLRVTQRWCELLSTTSAYLPGVGDLTPMFGASGLDRDADDVRRDHADMGHCGRVRRPCGERAQQTRKQEGGTWRHEAFLFALERRRAITKSSISQPQVGVQNAGGFAPAMGTTGRLFHERVEEDAQSIDGVGAGPRRGDCGTCPAPRTRGDERQSPAMRSARPSQSPDSMDSAARLRKWMQRPYCSA